MNSDLEERLTGHTELCTLRYETIGKRLDRIEKSLYGGGALLIIQLFTTVFFLLSQGG